MTLLQQFKTEHPWWDEFEERMRFNDELTEEQQYESACRNASCLDCLHCKLSDGFPVGYCLEEDEFRYESDKPFENDWNCLEPRTVAR